MVDSETRFVIGFHLSPHRDSPQVASLLYEARKYGKPGSIVSDRYSAYKVPVKSLFDDVKHIRVESFKDDISNNLIECFNKQFKAWYKTKQGFPSFRSANNLISMFVFFFNFVRPHSALDGLTPARVAGLSLSKNKNRGICLWYNTFLTFRPYLHNIGFECFVKAGAAVHFSLEKTRKSDYTCF